MGSQKVKRASQAYSYAMKHIEVLTEAGKYLRTNPKMSKRIDGLKRGIPFRWDYDDRVLYEHETLVRVGDLMGEIAVCELWMENGRVVYDMHEMMAKELARSRMKAVPGRLFNRLPHINPMVLLPEPWSVSDPVTKTYGLVRGFFIFGWSGRALCNTTDPNREGLGVLYFYDIEDKETGEYVPGPNRLLVPLPTFKDKLTIDETITFVDKWVGASEAGMDLKTTKKILTPLLYPTFSVLTYLCCDNRDLQEPVRNTRKKKHRKERKAKREPFWVRVGWYVGPALHEARRRANSTNRGLSVPSGAEQGPQHRAGHYRIAWVGHGPDKDPTSVWVKPYWTKRHLLEGAQQPVTQVVPVNPQRHDPMRRRNLRK